MAAAATAAAAAPAAVFCCCCCCSGARATEETTRQRTSRIRRKIIAGSRTVEAKYKQMPIKEPAIVNVPLAHTPGLGTN